MGHGIRRFSFHLAAAANTRCNFTRSVRSVAGRRGRAVADVCQGCVARRPVGSRCVAQRTRHRRIGDVDRAHALADSATRGSQHVYRGRGVWGVDDRVWFLHRVRYFIYCPDGKRISRHGECRDQAIAGTTGYAQRNARQGKRRQFDFHRCVKPAG